MTTGAKNITGIVWAVLAGFLAIGAFAGGFIVGGLLLVVSAAVALPAARGPLGRYGVAGGKRAGVAGAAALVGLIAAAAVAPSPEQQAKLDAAAKVEAAKVAASEKAEAAKAAQTAKAEAEKAKVAARPAFLAQYRQMLALAKPCDQSIGVVGDAASAGSIIAVYSAAKAGQEACQTAWLDIKKLEPDDMPEAAEAKQNEAIETCSNAYYLRQRAMETAMKIADGEGKASNIVSFQDDMKGGQAGVLLCVVKWIETGGALGVDPKAMS